MKGAEFNPAAIVTAAGPVNSLVEMASTTFAPAAGAYWLRVTVQTLAADGERSAGLQTSEEMTAEGTRATVAPAELPL